MSIRRNNSRLLKLLSKPKLIIHCALLFWEDYTPKQDTDVCTGAEPMFSYSCICGVCFCSEVKIGTYSLIMTSKYLPHGHHLRKRGSKDGKVVGFLGVLNQTQSTSQKHPLIHDMLG